MFQFLDLVDLYRQPPERNPEFAENRERLPELELAVGTVGYLRQRIETSVFLQAPPVDHRRRRDLLEYFHRPRNRPGGIVDRARPYVHRNSMPVPVPQEQRGLMWLAVQHHRRERATFAADPHARTVAVHQQVPLAKMPGYFLRQIAADLLRAPVPIHNPPLAIHHIYARFQVIEQRLVQFPIVLRLLNYYVFRIWTQVRHRFSYSGLIGQGRGNMTSASERPSGWNNKTGSPSNIEVITWPALPTLPILTLLAAGFALAQVTTSQYDSARTGANLNETTLTPASVNAAGFGKLFALRVDGDIYAQPLYLTGVEIPGHGKHDVVFAATEHDSVYAFDAAGRPTTPLWRRSFLDPGGGITTVPAQAVQCPFIQPEIGITPTPVIDRHTGTLYVLARTKEGSRYVQRLHALAITSGVEKFGGPVEIKASVPGHGAAASGGRIDFDPLRELPRASLLLSAGQIYMTWASSCDVAPYHGWVMAYDAHTLAQTAVWNTSPDAEESGIWQSDTGPPADPDGNVFLATGNGRFDVADSLGRDYGDSVLKLALAKGTLQVRDFFTPYNQKGLNSEDLDIGSGGPLLLPDQPGPHPHLLLVGGKQGVLYLIDRDHMGKFGPDNRQAVQVLPLSTGIYSAAAYWNQHVYIFAADDVLKDFALQQGRLSQRPVSQGITRFIDPGATPTISANGSHSGVVWVLRSKGWCSPDTPAVLYAFDAANVAHQLYSSEENHQRDRAGLCLRFNIPTVANGRVYAGAKGEVDVYGLLPAVSR